MALKDIKSPYKKVLIKAALEVSNAIEFSETSLLYLCFFADDSFDLSAKPNVFLFILLCRQHRIVQDSARTTKDGLGQCRNVRDSARHCRTVRYIQDSVGECRTVQDGVGQCGTMWNIRRTVRDTTGQCRTLQESARQLRTV
jgi:hypothetical protein